MTTYKELDRRQFFQPVVETISLTLRLPASIWLPDRSGKALRIVAATELPDGYVRTAFLRLDEPSVASEVIKSGRSIVVKDIVSDRRWKYRAEAADMGLQSAMIVPLQVKKKTVGVLDVYTHEIKDFTEDERSLIESLAAQAAFTQRRIRDLEVLNEVSLLINSELRPSALFKHITRSATRVLECQHVSIFLTDKSGNLALEATSAKGIKRKQFAPGQGLAGWVVQNGKSALVLDAVHDPRFIPGLLSDATERSMLVVPIITAEHESVGAISADKDGLNEFDEHDQALLETLAMQAAVAVHNAQLLEQAADRAKVLQRLHQIGEQLHSAELSERGLMRVLRQVARSAKGVLGADLVDVYQYVETEKRYVMPPILEGTRRDPTVVKEEIFNDDVVVEVVEGGKPLYAPDAQADTLLSGPFTIERPQRPKNRFVVREGVLSSAAVPLMAAGETVGAMFVNYRTHQDFAPDQRETIELFANQAATAIYNARAYEQVQRRIKALEALNEVGQRLSTAEVTGRGLSSLLREVARQAKRVLSADLVELYRYSPGREDLVAAHVSVGEKLVDIEPVKRILPDDVAAQILNLSTPLFTTDSQRIPLLSEPFRTERKGMPEQRFVVRERIVSTAAIPLIVSDEAVGILFVNYRSPQKFPMEQRELIQLFASQAAVAIRNAQLFQQRETLQRIARDITSVLDGDTLLQRTLERSLELLNCEFGSISVFDPANNTLQFRYAVGKASNLSVHLGEGLIGTAAETRKLVRVPDVSQDHRYISHVAETRSELDVPMLVGKRLIGVLNAESRRLNAFSKADERLAEALAAQAAVAFQTAEMYEETRTRLQERVGDIKALEAIYALIGTASLENVLGQIAEEAARLTPARYTGIWLLDEQAHELRFGASNKMGAPTMDLPWLPLDETSINGHVALSGKTYLARDIRGNPYYREWYEDVRSELATPLMYGDKVIGTLNLESAEIGAFAADHVRLVEALAGAAAVAIQSARLYDRLRTLTRVGQTVASSLDQKEVLERILEESLKALGANYGTLRLLDRTTNELVLRAYRGEISNQSLAKIPLGKGITGWVAEHGQPVLVGDVRKDRRYLAYLAGTRCEMTVPIKVDSKIIGVLNVEHPRPYAFGEQDLRLLEAIASQVATAIRNAELYETIQNFGHRLAALVDFSQAVTSGIHLREDQVLDLIHSQASRLMDTNNMYIALYDEPTDTVRFGLAFDNDRRVDITTEKGWQPRRAGKGKTEEIIRTKKPLFHATKTEGKAWYTQPDHTEYVGAALPSWLGVPMMVGEKVLGVIATYHPTQDHIYTNDDLEILQAMANQAAIALDNAHMFYDINRRLAALVDFSQTVTSGIRLREDKVLELIYKHASKLMDTDNMYIALYDEPTDTVRFGLVMVEGSSVDVQPRKAGEGRTEEIIRAKRPIFIATKEEAKAWYDEPGRKDYLDRREMLSSWLGVPMMVGEKVLGVIATYHPTQEYVYSGDDLNVLQAMANQAAIAIETARLQQEQQHQLDKKIGDILASREIDRAIVDSIRPGPELQSVLDLMLEKALERTEASSGNIMWYDEATEDLVMRAGKGVLEGKERARQKIGEGIVGLAARDRKTYRVGNVTEEPWKSTFIPFIANVRSELTTPLLDGDTLLGALNVEDPEVDAFDEEEARWLEDLAVRAVIAIRGAQAYEALQQEQSKNMATARLAAVNAVAAGFVHRMNNIAGTIPVRVEQIRELLDPSSAEHPKIMHYIDAIDEDVDSLLRAAQAIQSSTATEPLQLADIDTLVSTAIQRIAAPPGIVIHSRCDRELLLVLAFSGQLVDTLENLIRNGIEAIDGSGSVAVTGRTLVAEGQEWIATEITDTGRGIPPEELPRIFDLFFSTKPGGMGFALWRAKTLVESLGGRITISSRVGQGTTFTILLPAVKEA